MCAVVSENLTAKGLAYHDTQSTTIVTMIMQVENSSNVLLSLG